MAGDPFTSAIFRWLNGIAADPSLPPAAFKLAYIISQHINRESHTAWPSQETLAKAVGVKSERSVRRLSEALEAGGHLLTTQRKQTSQIYRLAQDRTELFYLQEPEQTASEPRPDEIVRSFDQDRTILSSRPDISVLKTGQKCPPNHLNNHLRNQEGESRARATFLPDDFKVSDETYSWALERLGFNDAVDRSLERFKNHFRQVEGSKAKSRDWHARARNWIDDDASKNRPDNSLVGATKRLHEKPASLDWTSSEADGAYRAALQSFVKFRRWTRHVGELGPEPGAGGCRVPKHLLIEFGLAEEDAA